MAAQILGRSEEDIRFRAGGMIDIDGIDSLDLVSLIQDLENSTAEMD